MKAERLEKVKKGLVVDEETYFIALSIKVGGVWVS